MSGQLTTITIRKSSRHRPYYEHLLPMMSGKVDRHFSHVVIVGKPGSDAVTESLLEKLHAHLLENRVKASIRHGRLRFAFHFYNTQDEIEKVLALLRARVRR